MRPVERLADHICELRAAGNSSLSGEQRLRLVREVLPEMIRRELEYSGALPDGASFAARLLAWVELA